MNTHLWYFFTDDEITLAALVAGASVDGVAPLHPEMTNKLITHTGFFIVLI
jgi:hypothetical protein